MLRILVVDDEETIRKNLERLLKLEGFEVATAADGEKGMAMAQTMLPDIVITDINMPIMDGFSLLKALRGHALLERVVVIMLTAAEDRSHMRQGMQLGADDYITKPFKREELLESIHAQLRKLQRHDKHKSEVIEQAVARAVSQNEEQAQAHFRKRYDANDSLYPNQTGSFNSSGIDIAIATYPLGIPAAGNTLKATVLFADIRNFTTMAERLSAAEVATLLGRYFELACRPVVAYGGTHLKMLGDGLMALFEDEAHANPEQRAYSHASRALSAALGIKTAAHDFKAWVADTYADRGLPTFSIGIGLHSGEVTLGQLGSLGAQEVTPLGDSVNIASRLQSASKALGWTIVASIDTTDLVGAGIDKGRHQVLPIRGRQQSVSACEVLGYTAPTNFQLTTAITEQALQSLDIASVAQENSQITARAVKGALKQSLWNLQSGSFTAQKQRFKGYEVIRKLGEGGMSDVFLAYSGARKCEVVLKVLRTAMHNDADMLRRFIQEYAVLAAIDHHHIAKIYDQGFTDDYAYISMEYLSGGSLSLEISQQPSHTRVIDLLRQITSALGAIHQMNLVYRDLKPDNLMFRGDGALVLVDFGIVKSIVDDTSPLVRTSHGQIIGTPYYVSPEQACGKQVTNRSDFYSLGIIMYELLTGHRPYRADSLVALLNSHIHGPTPQLPTEHAKFQPLLNRLMHKIPEERPADATAVWRNFENLLAD
jgi:serine/threonine-protein kinase PpkA